MVASLSYKVKQIDKKIKTILGSKDISILLSIFDSVGPHKI